MKKLLSFIPLGIGISALIIYVFNVISFRVINDGATNLQILSNLKIYLYVAIAGFVIYFMIKILEVLSKKRNIKLSEETVKDDQQSYEPFESASKIDNVNDVKTNIENKNVYVPNYDYVPMYHEEVKGNYLASESKKEDVIINTNNKKNVTIQNTNDKNFFQEEKKENTDNIIHEKEKFTPSESKKELNSNSHSYCYNCGNKINYNDKYCSKCGAVLKVNRKNTNPILKNIINVLEIVILILIIYFSLNMLFEYKENKDPNFKSPFKVSLTK